MKPADYDLIIIGGGPVGAALALALRSSGVSALVLESREAPANDPRPLALSYGSMLILQRLGVWRSLRDVTRIATIHVSHRGGFGRSLMSAREAGLPALGFVVNYRDLCQALDAELKSGGVGYFTGAQVTRIQTTLDHASAEYEYRGQTLTVTAKLAALADGGRFSDEVGGVRQHVRDYRQWAVVTRVRSELPHHNVAYERFTPSGPVALLPCGEDFALVWTASEEQAREILSLDDPAFLSRLHGHFGHRLGQFVYAEKRSGFPLVLKYASPVTAKHVALLGNAAQSLHPVAGQGFNLGLRDAWELGAEICDSAPHEIGAPEMLQRYRRRRGFDSGGGIFFTDSLVRLFSNSDPVLNLGRGIGLAALDCFPAAKRFLARRMIFGARG